MSDRVIVTRSLLENVASSIRKKTNTDKTLTLKGMAEAVDGMECPPSYDGEYTITENGTYKTGGKKMNSDLTVNVASSSSKNTLKTLLDARKSCYHLFYYYLGTSVDDLISYEDTSNVTNMTNMFEECYYLESIPLLDTSKVTNLGSTFRYCQSLTSIPQLDTSNVESFYGTFYFCTSLTSIPQLDTSKVTNMGNAFYNCQSLTSIPQLDTSKVTNMGNAFYKCKRLTSILMTGTKCSFDITYTSLQPDALVVLLNNLGTPTSTATLTMGANKLALLTDDEKKIATDKGWTLA